MKKISVGTKYVFDSANHNGCGKYTVVLTGKGETQFGDTCFAGVVVHSDNPTQKVGAYAENFTFKCFIKIPKRDAHGRFLK